MTTTTSKFQVNPDYYTSIEQCSKHSERVQTNPRYRNFMQTHFTAGDEEQFQQYRGMYNGNVCIPRISLSNNLFASMEIDVWTKFRDLRANCVDNTFNYIFNKFKKGIFIKIVSNKLVVFLPFSKHGFVNEWGNRVQVDRNKYKSIYEFLEYIATTEGYKFNKDRVNPNPSEWYGNNSLVRYENPLCEGDSSVDNVKNLLEELCENRQVPDIELFINRRDYPIMTKDGTEAYHHLWGTKKQKLVSHSYSEYCPILSMCVTDRYADVLMPTWEDWARVQSYDSKFFVKPCKSYKETFDTPWSNKVATAVFRGSTTGSGVTIETNPRLKLAWLSAVKKPVKDGIPYLDAGITKWNTRPRMLEREKYIKTIEIEKLGFGLVNKLTPQEQSKYKYIINVDGHVSAYRLSLELSMGSVILLADSEWRVWYKHMLKPWVHYVPVKADLSDLIDQIQWCRNNDSKCQVIVKNAKEFFDKYLQKNGVLDYMQKTLVELKNKMGVYLYNTKTPLTTMIEYELVSLSDLSYPGKIVASNTSITTGDNGIINDTIEPEEKVAITGITNITEFPLFMGRCFGLLKGVQLAVSKLAHTKVLEQSIKISRTLFRNKLGEVSLCNIGGIDMAIKHTNDTQKVREHVHEAYIGIECINTRLCKYYPNFAFTFGIYSNDKGTNVVTEYIHGGTLFDYISSNKFDMNTFLLILIQLSLALHVAQNACAFVHYDLAPWNIMLSMPGFDLAVDYLISFEKKVTVKHSIVPVMIDFGKSHVVHQGKHHGFINPFNVSTCQDIVTLLVTSLAAILEKQPNLDTKDTNTVLYLANFLSNTGYRKKPFVTGNELLEFLRGARKYANLISNNKYELEQKTPYDLFLHVLNKRGDYPLTFVEIHNKPSVFYSIMNRGNERQVFDYAFSSTVKDRLKSYTMVCTRLKQSTLPQPTNRFFAYYVAQGLYDGISSTYSDAKDYVRRIGTESIDIQRQHTTEVNKVFVNALNFLVKFYTRMISSITRTKLEYTLDTNSASNLVRAPYDESTFLLPKNMINVYTGLNKIKYKDLSSNKEMIVQTLLSDSFMFKIPDKEKQEFISMLDGLLKTSSLNMINNAANTRTLDFLIKSIYLDDLYELSNTLSKQDNNKDTDNDVGNCDSAIEYVGLYSKLLDLVK